MDYRFKPYKGATYRKKGHQLLILGESHYGTEEASDTELTNWVMNDWRVCKKPHTVLTNTARLLTGHESSAVRQNRSHYFNGCIFYNYIQAYVGKRHNDFDAEFQAHLPLFEQLIREHTPTHILGWGWRLGEGIIKAINTSNSGATIERDTTIDGYRLAIGDVSCATMFITHPSARGDIYAKHSKRVNTFLRAYGGVPLSTIYNGTDS